MSTYVHGYDARENRRLREQSGILREILHAGTAYPKGVSVLEAGWVDEALWKQGISDLHETSRPPTGTFFYTWFKAVGVK